MESLLPSGSDKCIKEDKMKTKHTAKLKANIYNRDYVRKRFKAYWKTYKKETR